MSALSPASVIAPWDGEWKRHPAQTIVLELFNPGNQGVIVPDGEWWRIIWLQAAWLAGAAAGNRYAQFLVTADDGTTQPVKVLSPFTQAVNVLMQYSVSPQQATWEQASDTLNSFQHWPIPDLVYPQGYKLEMELVSLSGGDAAGTPSRNLLSYEYFTVEQFDSQIVQAAPVAAALL